MQRGLGIKGQCTDANRAPLSLVHFAMCCKLDFQNVDSRVPVANRVHIQYVAKNTERSWRVVVQLRLWRAIDYISLWHFAPTDSRIIIAVFTCCSVFF